MNVHKSGERVLRTNDAQPDENGKLLRFINHKPKQSILMHIDFECANYLYRRCVCVRPYHPLNCYLLYTRHDHFPKRFSLFWMLLAIPGQRFIFFNDKPILESVRQLFYSYFSALFSSIVSTTTITTFTISHLFENDKWKNVACRGCLVRPSVALCALCVYV